MRYIYKLKDQDADSIRGKIAALRKLCRPFEDERANSGIQESGTYPDVKHSKDSLIQWFVADPTVYLVEEELLSYLVEEQLEGNIA